MITFPITPEAFIAFMEAGTGKRADKTDRDFLSEIAGLVNTYFEDGKEGREMAAPGALDYYRMIGQATKFDKPKIQRMLASINWWCREAYKAGRASNG